MTKPFQHRHWAPRQSRKRGATGFRGVTVNGPGYRAELYIEGRRLSLGTFPTALEAAIAWDKAALEHCGPRTDLNFGVPDSYVPHQLTIEEYQNGESRNS
jgi:hypothetical protein